MQAERDDLVALQPAADDARRRGRRFQRLPILDLIVVRAQLVGRPRERRGLRQRANVGDAQTHADEAAAVAHPGADADDLRVRRGVEVADSGLQQVRSRAKIRVERKPAEGDERGD